MILEDKKGNRYKAHFQHSHVRQANPQTRNEQEIGSTVCTFHAGECATRERPCGTESTLGVAHCSYKDAFERAVGRRVAFTRAIQHLPKPLRAELWESYWELNKKQKAG